MRVLLCVVMHIHNYIYKLILICEAYSMNSIHSYCLLYVYHYIGINIINIIQNMRGYLPPDRGMVYTYVEEYETIPKTETQYT